MLKTTLEFSLREMTCEASWAWAAGYNSPHTTLQGLPVPYKYNKQSIIYLCGIRSSHLACAESWAWAAGYNSLHTTSQGLPVPYKYNKTPILFFPGVRLHMACICSRMRLADTTEHSTPQAIAKFAKYIDA